MQQGKMLVWLTGVVLLVAFTTPVLGQNPTIDYYGYAWQDASGSKAVGDALKVVGVADFADAMFGVDLGVEELTFWIYDLTLASETDMGGYFQIEYSGGYLEIWRDGAQNADWGINPPNPTAPSTFMDGTLFFRGSFNNFTLFEAGGAGSYEGTLNGLAGEMIGSVCVGCAYTFGGLYTTDVGALIPEGYDFQADGLFEIEAVVAEETASWGSVKALFRN